MKHFEKYAQEANTFINRLAKSLGHPEEKEQTLIALRAVLQTLRDRQSIEENLDALSQLPMFLKSLYVEQWTATGKQDKFKTLEDFLDEIEKTQQGFGEREFNWNISTREIAIVVLQELREYWTEGQWNHIEENMPEEIAEFFREEVEM